MPKHTDIMNKREEEIAKLIELLAQKSKDFTKPKLILIGGYALRAYIPLSRYTRDCDFVIRHQKAWHIDQIKKWFTKEIDVQSFEKMDTYGYARFIKPMKIGKASAKIALDFMEGEVRGRTEKDIVTIDNKFVEDSEKAEIPIGTKKIPMFVPTYQDYLILKIASARSSDIRDIATLIWKNKIPKDLSKRSKEILPYPEILTANIQDRIIPDISHPRFLDSWRGTYVTKEFDEESKEQVLKELNGLLRGK